MSTLLYLIPVALFLVIVFFLIVRMLKNRSDKSSKQYYPENKQLYVGNLPYQVNSDELNELFSSFGEVESARVVRNNKTGRSKGFAFVTYASVVHAKKALKLNGKTVRGRALVVRMAKPRSE